MASGNLILTPVMSAEYLRQLVDGGCEVALIAASGNCQKRAENVGRQVTLARYAPYMMGNSPPVQRLSLPGGVKRWVSLHAILSLLDHWNRLRFSEW